MNTCICGTVLVQSATVYCLEKLVKALYGVEISAVQKSLNLRAF